MTSGNFTRSALLTAALLLPNLAHADNVQAEAQSAADKWDKAYNSGNMDGLAGTYSKDAVVVTKGAPQTGEGIQKFFSGLKEKGWDEHKTSVKSAIAKDKLVIVTGRWEMMGPGEGGAKKKFEGNWVNVLERQGDGMKTVLHTWN